MWPVVADQPAQGGSYIFLACYLKEYYLNRDRSLHKSKVELAFQMHIKPAKTSSLNHEIVIMQDYQSNIVMSKFHVDTIFHC